MSKIDNTTNINSKNEFVFNGNPWKFVKANNKLYITNIESNIEKIEEDLNPDEISGFDSYYGIPCKYFLFRTNETFSIYNVETKETIITFKNHIYSNDHLIIYKKEEETILYNYVMDVTLTLNGQYSFGKKFYYIENNTLYGLNLHTDYTNIISEVGEIKHSAILYNNYLLKLNKDEENKEYEYYWLGNGEKRIEKTTIVLPFYISKFMGIETEEFTVQKANTDKFLTENKKLLSQYSQIQNLSYGLNINQMTYEWKKKIEYCTIIGKIITYPQYLPEQYITIKEKNKGFLFFKDANFENSSTDTHNK